mgnify:CR=1 FL=1
MNWVVQLDCPEDANTYIHRAGRTARYETDGQSLLVLLPSEEQGMLKQLADKKIPIEQIRYRTDTVFVESSFTITTTLITSVLLRPHVVGTNQTIAMF